MSATGTIDPDEIARFDALAAQWWDERGPMAPLHRLNPARLGFLRQEAEAHFGCDTTSLRPLQGLSAVDVGCGAGLLSEPLARLGAEVTAIDAAGENIAAARRHAEAAGLDIDYRQATAADLAAEERGFDLVVCMEVIEHVPDQPGLIAECVALAKPGGLLALSTLNRTAPALAFAVIGAEYVVGLLPRGTHDWRRFVRPRELKDWLRQAGAEPRTLSGLNYRPISDEWVLTRRTPINYLLTAVKAT
ncbi:MAG: bifunctional 2-polyprenyl-6-hydroxyphenol methylase/3-demethylubiquinol 3-O-methyltransferase UbiG [Alphaproteobacteria bacterium]